MTAGRHVWAAGVALAMGVGVLGGAPKPQSLWLDVPFVKQAPEGCGAACIAMVIQYWAKATHTLPGDDANAATIQKLLYDPRAGGIKARDMERYFRQNGFDTFAFHGEWRDLERHLSQGRPLIVCLREGGAFAHSLHYVVLVGLDDEQNAVLVNDPAGRKLMKLDRAGFQKKWSAMNDWTLLALPRQDR
jgi:ABC-type bacteriocin/lantibiotic exporter with double-glycine peptidase domain